jgi:alpha-L-fucosidase 2
VTIEYNPRWSSFWYTGATVDLGGNQSSLEGFYYAMQYQLGSGTRPGNTAPGLYGPWQTTEIQGFQGDYTMDYVSVIALRVLVSP